MSFFLAAKISPFDLSVIFSNFLSEWYYYLVAVFVIVAIIFAGSILKVKTKINLTKTQRLAFISALCAFSVVANMLSFGPDTFKFSLVILVSFIGGFLLGPSGGFTVGFVGDLIAGFVAPQGVYNPLIALASGLWGFFVGLTFCFKGNNYLKTVISILIGFVFCSMFLNTAGVYIMYIYPSTKYASVFAYMLVRLPTQLINCGINMACSILLMPALFRLKLKYVEVIKNKKDNTNIETDAVNHIDTNV